MSINVMQVVHDLNFGGMQRIVVDLCRFVDPQVYKMSVCCLEEIGPNAIELEKIKTPVYLVKKRPGFDISLPFRLRNLFIKHKCNIVHTHGINPFFYGTLGAKAAGNIRTVQTDHARGLFPVAPKEMLSERIVSWIADRIVAVSQGVRYDLILYERINPKKISVIYNGINGDKYRISVDRHEKIQEFNILKDDIIIGVGVRLSEQKGICYLIDAFEAISLKYPNAKLLIVGDGELRGQLERRVQKKGLERKIIFTGFRSDIPELLQIMDIYVLPSLWEGHPLVLLEVMAAGKPIIATDIPGNHETVQNGESGFLVPVKNPQAIADKLQVLIKDQSIRRRMGDRGKKIFNQRFTVNTMVDSYQNLYSSMFNCVKALV